MPKKIAKYGVKIEPIGGIGMASAVAKKKA